MPTIFKCAGLDLKLKCAGLDLKFKCAGLDSKLKWFSYITKKRRSGPCNRLIHVKKSFKLLPTKSKKILEGPDCFLTRIRLATKDMR